jgi:c-di-GMP-related signal transduction protein
VTRPAPFNVQYLARQPILDSEERTVGYELLYRAAPESSARITDNDAASREVLKQVISLGARELSAGKRLYINCSHELLVQDYVTVLPPENTVVEVLEWVEPTAEVLDACRRLKEAGFTIALDDFIPGPRSLPFVPFADIIKIDFRNTTARVRRELLDRYCQNIQALAEKLESREEYKSAIKAGFTLFQGYFFCEPVLLANRQLLPLPVNHRQLVDEARRKAIDFGRMEEIIKSDPALCHRLLRYLNSCGLCRGARFTSIHHALTLLGEKELRKWVAVACDSPTAAGCSITALASALLRARFGELLAPKLGCRAYDMFIVGLLSLMDTLMGISLERVVSQVRVSPESAAGLLGQDTSLRGLLQLVVAYERGDWETVRVASVRFELPPEQLNKDYRRAVAWVGGILEMNAEDDMLPGEAKPRVCETMPANL